MIAETHVAALKALLGEGGWSQDPEQLAPKLMEWRDRWFGETPLLVLPRTTEEVAAVVRYCAEHGIAITPQGGNTGLVGGQTPKGEILLSTEKLNRLIAMNPVDDVIEVGAGAILADVQRWAAEDDRFFPLSLASEGSATIGGLISTNAGGVAVLRYGTMRALVLGLEVVLPNGEIHRGLKRLRKDNTGYDLKHLFIGAEGTLGVITAASLRLFPIMRSRATAFVALKTAEDAMELLKRARSATGGQVEAFELLGALGLRLVTAGPQRLRPPLGLDHPWQVLIEIAAPIAGSAEAMLEAVLTEVLETGLVVDAAVAQNQAQAAEFWALREGQSAAQKGAGPAWKHDVSVPVSAIAVFLERAGAALEATWPGVRIQAFGHVGDGNIHYGVIMPEGGDPGAFEAARDAGARIVHDIANDLHGSVSAEHGLGTMKVEEARRYKSAAELAAQRAIREALDPKRIMNPRVLF